MSYPRHIGPFVRVFISFSYVILMNHGRFSYLKILCSLSFFYILLFKDGYALTHTHTHKCRYPTTPEPLGNDTVIAFSDSEDLIYHAEYEGEEDCEVLRELPDYYSKRKELFSLMRIFWIQSTWVPRMIKRKSK